jgi:microcystin-dependent protein
LGGIAYACQRGYTFTWDSTQDYEVGCVVIDSTDGKRYECIADVSANATPPSSDTTHWQTYGQIDSFEVGDLKFIAHNVAISDGWLLCDGSAVSRTTYAELFDVIGTTYGVGDGTTTFNLPDYSDGKFFEGSGTAGTVKSAGLPNITGAIGTVRADWSPIENSGVGALKYTVNDAASAFGLQTSSTNSYHRQVSFDASRSNAIYSDSVTTVQPYSMTCRVLIKYE